jgi:hypothetical protein
VLVLVLLFSDVHPLGSVTAGPVAVDIVTPEEIPERKAEPAVAPEKQPALDLSVQPAASSPPIPAPAAASPSEAAAPSPSPPPSASQTAAAQPATPPPPAYVPPEPDLSVKYQVMLGLPPDLSSNPPPAKSVDGAGEPFDGPASTAANVAPSVVAEFRRHLRTCLRLPQSIAASDKLRIKLRVVMTLEARLAAEPVLIEASASPKGPALMRSAISALQACQPYAMLPADRYGEWKVLDLSFTPQDFAG